MGTFFSNSFNKAFRIEDSNLDQRYEEQRADFYYKDFQLSRTFHENLFWHRGLIPIL